MADPNRRRRRKFAACPRCEYRTVVHRSTRPGGQVWCQSCGRGYEYQGRAGGNRDRCPNCNRFGPAHPPGGCPPSELLAKLEVRMTIDMGDEADLVTEAVRLHRARNPKSRGDRAFFTRRVSTRGDMQWAAVCRFCPGELVIAKTSHCTCDLGTDPEQEWSGAAAEHVHDYPSHARGAVERGAPSSLEQAADAHALICAIKYLWTEAPDVAARVAAAAAARRAEEDAVLDRVRSTSRFDD